MPSKPNPFDELSVAFRDGHAEYGGGGFQLYVLTPAQAGGYHASPACGYLGSIFFREPKGARAPSCYVVFGNFRGRNWAESKDAFELFARLARRAGGQLPLAVQQQFSAKQNDPTGAWLACMWLHSPPVDDQFHHHTSWPEPFLDAANAIERAELCSTRNDVARSDTLSGGAAQTIQDASAATSVATPSQRLKPSRAKAKGLYEWAMEHMDGAEDMTYAQLFDVLQDDPHCAGEGLPDNAEAFARYCRAAGIQRNTPRRSKGPTRSVRRASNL